jgi:hypothetical protein
VARSSRARTSSKAQLQGANLSGAKLQGADLRGAQLQGANLADAELQGVNLENAKLTLALPSDVYLWRAQHASCADARITNPIFDAVLEPPEDPTPVFSATPEGIEKLIRHVTTGISDGPRKNDELSTRKDRVRDRMREGLIAPIEQDDPTAEANWKDCAANSEKVSDSEYLQKHVSLLRDLVCNATTSRKEIATGIIGIWINEDNTIHPDYSSRLALSLLGKDGKDCAATKDMSNQTRERLYEIASRPMPAN